MPCHFVCRFQSRYWHVQPGDCTFHPCWLWTLRAENVAVFALHPHWLVFPALFDKLLTDFRTSLWGSIYFFTSFSLGGSGAATVMTAPAFASGHSTLTSIVLPWVAPGLRRVILAKRSVFTLPLTALVTVSSVLLMRDMRWGYSREFWDIPWGNRCVCVCVSVCECVWIEHQSCWALQSSVKANFTPTK